MSLNNSYKKYVNWRPNRNFVKFFEALRKRRIAENDPSIQRVTNTSPSNGKENLQQKSTKQIKLMGASEAIKNAAESESGVTYKRTNMPKQRAIKKKGSRSKDRSVKNKKKRKIEKSISDYSFK